MIDIDIGSKFMRTHTLCGYKYMSKYEYLPVRSYSVKIIWNMVHINQSS